MQMYQKYVYLTLAPIAPIAPIWESPLANSGTDDGLDNLSELGSRSRIRIRSRRAQGGGQEAEEDSEEDEKLKNGKKWKLFKLYYHFPTYIASKAITSM